MSTPDPALLDTDVASVPYRARLFQRVVPSGLVGVVAERTLATSVITLGEAGYGRYRVSGQRGARPRW